MNQSDATDPLFFLTGASGFIGGRLTLHLAEKGRRLALLCRPASAEELERRIQTWPQDLPRPRILLGDLQQPDLGLTDFDQQCLREECGGIFHLAARYDLGMDEEEARAANVDGTARVLDLAAACRAPMRFHHMSSIAVSGDFDDLFGEQDYDAGQQPLHAYGHSKFLAEGLVRGSGLPASIYRAGVVVGDSRTGEMDKVDGPYYVFRILHHLRKLPGASRLPMIVPKYDDSLFHLVPVDYVVSSLAALAKRSKPDGLECWHLCDPQPPSFRQFYQATLAAYGFGGPRIQRPVKRLFRLLCKPGPFALAKSAAGLLGLPAEMLPHLIRDVRYDTRLTEQALEKSGAPACPALLPLVPRLVDFFESHMA